MADIDTSYLDSDADSIRAARPALLETTQRVNALSAAAGASLIGGLDKVVASISDLRALSKLSLSKNTFVTGYYAAGDGGGGAYWYDSADTTTVDNGGTVVIATDGARWKLAQGGLVSSKQFGAKGDYIADDTTALNKWLAYLTAGAAVNQHCGYWQTGTYKITGAGLLVTIADTLPTMITDGAESVILKGSITTLITFTVSGGSGMVPTVGWAGLKLDGIANTGTNEGVRVNGLCFFTLKGWHFYNLGIAGRLYNLGAGLFTEGVVFEDCYYHTSVTTSLRYSVGAGTNSFRSSGLRNCKINIGATSQPILIDAGCVPYMAPMDVTLWNFNANCTFIQNNSSQCPMVGNITAETQGSANNILTLVAGSGYVFLHGAIIAWNYNSTKFFKGKLFRCKEYFNAPDIGQMYLPDNTSGSIITTGVGQTFSLDYNAGVHKPFQQDSAILTICVTNTGYFWQGVYMIMSGATDNVVNATPIASNLLTNTAGYGSMTISQGTGYNINVSNALTGVGTKCSYSYQYLYGLIPQS